MDLPEIALVRLWHPETRRAARILELARRIRQDINLCDWIHSENISKGVAPRTEACMVVYDSTSTHSADADDTESDFRATLLTSTNRMIAACFRARWGIELTKMKERTALRPHVLRQKAATQCAQQKKDRAFQKSEFGGRKMVPIWGPSGGPQNRTVTTVSSCSFGKKRSQIRAHFSKPRGAVFCGGRTRPAPGQPDPPLRPCPPCRSRTE